MSGIDRWGEAAQRAAEEARRLAETRVAEERAIQLARSLPQATLPANPRAPEETARLLGEVARLPTEWTARFLGAVPTAWLVPPSAGGTVSLPQAASALSERVALAFPENSDRRTKLGAALVKLRGGEPMALARSVLDKKAAAAIAGLASLATPATIVPAPAPTREPPQDQIERSRGFGPFGTPAVPPPAPSTPSPTPSLQETLLHGEVMRRPASDMPRLDARGGGSRPGTASDRDALTAALAPPSARSEKSPMASTIASFTALRVTGLRFDVQAGRLLASTAPALAERLSGFASSIARAREALWTRDDPSFRVRLGINLADEPLTHAMEATGALLASAPSLASRAERKDVLARLSSVRNGLADIREQARVAAAELEPVVPLARGRQLRTATSEIQELESGAQRAEREIRMVEGRTAVLAQSEEPAFADEGTATGAPPADFTDADLAALGTGLDPSKPPAQTLWNENMVNLVSAEGRKQGGLTEAEGAQNAELARQVLAASGARIEMTSADLAAVLKRSGLALERVDPNQVVAATRYLNTATTVADQQEKLRKVIDNFETLDRIGLPRMSREQLMGQLDTYAKVPGKATAKLTDAELRAKFGEVACALNGGGAIQTKVGKYDLKLEVGTDGQVLKSSCKKPGFFSRVGSFLKKVAPIALTALSFMGGPVTAGIARVVQGVISAVQAVKSKSLLGLATAAAGMVAGGAAAFASKTVGIAGSVANRVASLANSAARALQGFSAMRQGSLLSGLANIGGAVASGLGGFASGVGSRLGSFAKQLGDTSDKLLKGATVLSAAQAYRGAGREVDAAKRALSAARASGDARAVADATARLEAAERAKTGALFTGLGSTVMIAADAAGRRRSAGTGQPVDRPPASGLEAGLRAASRGLSLAGNVATRDFEAAGVNALGAAAALKSASAPHVEAPLDEAARAAAERVRDLLGGRTRVSTLNDLSNVADAALGYRQSDKADTAAAAAVTSAEQALAAARRTGDPAAVRAAEEHLRDARRGAEGALMGSIGAGDALLGTARVAGEQRRLAGSEEGAVLRIASSLRLEEELKGSEDLLGSPEDRDRASGLRVGLEVFRKQYERNLRLAAGDPQRMADLNAGFEALVASAEQQAPRMQLAANRAPDDRRTDASFVPPGATQASATAASLAELRKRSGLVLDFDNKTLDDEARQIRGEATEAGVSTLDPKKEKTREDYRRAVEEVEKLRADPRTTEADLLAAIVQKNSARLAYQAARNPIPSDPSPLRVGISTFFEEIGERGLAIISLGGTAAVQDAVKRGRLNGNSGELDTAKVYLEGILNGITFGGLNAFADSYAGAGKGLGTSLLDGLKAGGSSFIGIDDLKILLDPKANAWEKTAAGAGLMTRVAAAAAGGIAKTRYADVKIPNPFARRPGAAALPIPAGTSPAAAEGTMPPNSTAPSWQRYEQRYGGKQTPMETTFEGKTIKVRLDKPPSDAQVVDFKDFDWSNPTYQKPFIMKRVVEDFTVQIQKYKTIRPNVHLQFSKNPPSWVVDAIRRAGGTYSVAP